METAKGTAKKAAKESEGRRLGRQATKPRKPRARWKKVGGVHLYILNGVGEEALKKAAGEGTGDSPGQIAVLTRDRQGRPVVYGRYVGQGRGPLTRLAGADREYRMIAAGGAHCDFGRRLNVAYYLPAKDTERGEGCHGRTD